MHHPANRIPRIPPPRPSLYRRLHRWTLARRLAWLNSDIVELQHFMALDLAIARAYRIEAGDCPALSTRTRRQRSQLGDLIRKQGRLTMALAKLECRL